MDPLELSKQTWVRVKKCHKCVKFRCGHGIVLHGKATLTNNTTNRARWRKAGKQGGTRLFRAVFIIPQFGPRGETQLTSSSFFRFHAGPVSLRSRHRPLIPEPLLPSQSCQQANRGHRFVPGNLGSSVLPFDEMDGNLSKYSSLTVQTPEDFFEVRVPATFDPVQFQMPETFHPITSKRTTTIANRQSQRPTSKGIDQPTHDAPMQRPTDDLATVDVSRPNHDIRSWHGGLIDAMEQIGNLPRRMAKIGVQCY